MPEKPQLKKKNLGERTSVSISKMTADTLRVESVRRGVTSSSLVAVALADWIERNQRPGD